MTQPTETVPRMDWPPARSRVRADWDSGVVITRVMRPVDPQTIICVIPDDVRHDQLPPVGVEVTLSWADPDGVWRRTAEIGRLSFSLLTLVAKGEATREQRRQFYRAPIDLDVTLVDGARQTRGHLLDLSEGGARVSLTPGSPTPSTTVTTRMLMDGQHLVVPGNVVRTDDSSAHTEVGLEFPTLTGIVADVIRRHVFNAQVRRRKTETNR